MFRHCVRASVSVLIPLWASVQTHAQTFSTDCYRTLSLVTLDCSSRPYQYRLGPLPDLPAPQTVSVNRFCQTNCLTTNSTTRHIRWKITTPSAWSWLAIVGARCLAPTQVRCRTRQAPWPKHPGTLPALRRPGLRCTSQHHRAGVRL